MEIASKRTEEERSSQDKVDEEVSGNFCYELNIYLAFSKQWKMFSSIWQSVQLVSKSLFVIEMSWASWDVKH